MRPGAAAWTTDLNMAFGCITEHGPTLTGSNPEGKPFLISGLSLPRAWGIPQSHIMFWGWVCVYVSSRLLNAIPQILLGKDSMSTSALSLTICHHCVSSLASLHSLCTGLFFCLTSPSRSSSKCYKPPCAVRPLRQALGIFLYVYLILRENSD